VALLALFDTSNPAHFRNLSFSKWLRFRTVYLTDRFAKYGKRLIAREFRHFAADLRKFIRGHYRSLAWRIGRWSGRRTGASQPHAARYDPVMFDAVGRAYTPKPYPGRIELFRAAERTPEYGDDLTLGWRGMGRNGVNVYIVPGGHVTMMQRPDVIHLVRSLDECISRSAGQVSSDATFDDPSKLVLSFP
jgi:hypothetical protein